MRVPIFAALILLILSVLIDLFIFRDIRRYSCDKIRKILLWIYGILSVLCWAVIIAFLIHPKRESEVSILPAMWILFSYLTVYFSKFVYCICSLIGGIIRRVSHSKKNYGVICGGVLGIAIFSIMWWGTVYTRHDIVVNKFDISSDRLPASFDGMKVLQFSDIHVGTWGNDTVFISKLVDSINAQNADLILFTGDIVNRQSSELLPFKSVLSRLKARHGVYAVLGNHDYGGYIDWPSDEAQNEDVENLSAALQDMNWKLLKNSSDYIVENGDSIALIGVENWGEPPFNKLGDLKKAYPVINGIKDLNDTTFKILMTHNPHHWTKVVTDISNVNLTLSGHTHAMQCVLRLGDWQWSPAVFKYKQWGGLYTQNSKDKYNTPMHLYVNIGAGEVGFPARIGGAKPELTLFTLHSE